METAHYTLQARFIPSKTTLVPVHFTSEKCSLVSPVKKFPPADTPAPHSPYSMNTRIILEAWFQASSHHGINLPFHHKRQNGKERTKGGGVWNNHCFSLVCVWEEKVVTKI